MNWLTLRMIVFQKRKFAIVQSQAMNGFIIPMFNKKLGVKFES